MGKYFSSWFISVLIALRCKCRKNVYFIVICFVLQALYTQYLQFKEHDIPLKENEKIKIKNLYKMLEVCKYETEEHVGVIAVSQLVVLTSLRLCST